MTKRIFRPLGGGFSVGIWAINIVLIHMESKKVNSDETEGDLSCPGESCQVHMESSLLQVEGYSLWEVRHKKVDTKKAGYKLCLNPGCIR